MICDIAATEALAKHAAIKRAFEFEVESKLSGQSGYPVLSKREIREMARGIRDRMQNEHPEHYAEFIKHIEY